MARLTSQEELYENQRLKDDIYEFLGFVIEKSYKEVAILKIFLLSRWFVRWNGAAVTAYELSKRLCKNNEVTIVTHKGYFDQEWVAKIDDNIRVVGVKENPLNIKSLFVISNLIKREKPDIVHSQGLIGLSSWIAHCPYVVTYHGAWPMNWFLSWKRFVGGMLLTPMEYLEMKKASKVVTVSKFSQSSLSKYFDIQSTVVYNGIADAFLLDKNDAYMNHEVNDKPTLVFVGAVCVKKAKVLPLIAERLLKNIPDIQIEIVGKPMDYYLVKKLSSMPNVHVRGLVDNVKSYLDVADICILPSFSESLPYAVVEAQARGKPVIAFDVGGISEIVEDGQTGFVVPKGDVETFVYRIQELISDTKRIREMGRKAKNSVKARISWDKATRTYIKIYEEVISRGM